MEGTGSQPKRTNIPQAASCQGCSSPPFKSGFEKRKLSLRSKNAASFATQTAASSSRQQSVLVQKQSGKENELPFDRDIAEKGIATFGKSEMKRKKSVQAESEKRILKRRLSADYRDQLSSNKFYRGEIEPVNRPAKIGDFPRTAIGTKSHDNRPKFSIYDDGRSDAVENEIKGLLFSTDSANQRFGLRDIERREMCDKNSDKDVDRIRKLSKRWLQRVVPVTDIHAATKTRDGLASNDNPAKSASPKKVLTSESDSVNKTPKTVDSSVEKKRAFAGSNLTPESFDAEFRIERVDRKDAITPTMNNLRKFKSGSSIGQLKMTVRRGDEISPLKRRFNRFKRSVMNLKSSADVKTALTSALKCSEMGLRSAGGMKKPSKKRSNCTPESSLHPSTETTEETSSVTSTNHEIDGRSIQQGEKSNRRRSSEPSIIRVGKIANDASVYEDRHKLSSNCVVRDSPIRISSQRPVITLSPSSPNFENDADRAFDTEPGNTESYEQDIKLRKKWDAVVAEFKNKLKPGHEAKEYPIRGVASKETVKLAPDRTHGVRLQPSLSLQCKRPARCETNCELNKSASRANVREGIETRSVKTAIGTGDESARSEQDEDVEDCARTAFEALRTSRKVQKRDNNTTNDEEEIISIEYARERRAHQISKTFLRGKSIFPEQRKIVVNFLIGVHAYLLTSSSTLYQATRIFDAILDLKDVSMKELQLVALGASWIAIKNIETNVPSGSEMISFAKDMYSAGGSKLLCKCEQKILKTLNFNLRFSDPFYMLAHYIEHGLALGILPGEASIRKIYHCADYILNTALLDERYSGTSAKLLATGATRTAVNLVQSASENRAKWFQWQNEKITSYGQEEIERIVAPLLVGVLESAEKNSSTNAVYKKYKSSRYENISDYLIAKIKMLPEFSDAKKNSNK